MYGESHKYLRDTASAKALRLYLQEGSVEPDIRKKIRPGIWVTGTRRWFPLGPVNGIVKSVACSFYVTRSLNS